MIIVNLMLKEPPLDARVEGVRRIGRNLAAKQIKAERVVHVQLFLDRRQINDAQIADLVDVIGVSDASLVHRIDRRLNGAAHASFANEHMVRFFGQHKAAGAR